MMFVQGKRFAVFSIKEKDKGNHIWVRAGSAFVNMDGSMNVVLDVLPLGGRLHVREAMERRDYVPPVALSNGPAATALETQPAEGHS